MKVFTQESTVPDLDSEKITAEWQMGGTPGSRTVKVMRASGLATADELGAVVGNHRNLGTKLEVGEGERGGGDEVE